MRDGRLQGVEAVIERLGRLCLPESDDHRLFFRGQDRRFGFLQPSQADHGVTEVRPFHLATVF